jgi:hypothetical protein
MEAHVMILSMASIAAALLDSLIQNVNKMSMSVFLAPVKMVALALTWSMDITAYA